MIPVLTQLFKLFTYLFSIQLLKFNMPPYSLFLQLVFVLSLRLYTDITAVTTEMSVSKGSQNIKRTMKAVKIEISVYKNFKIYFTISTLFLYQL